ncbi:MAG: helix-turn-helix domain-containing protein [Oscillospiraceae bacterium]|jgi:AraC-like DNA-binding protein|nr:helix-turn-helix domain-containing protein [Oscillospiraceae bacterium]
MSQKINTVFLTFGCPVCREIQGKINWAWLDCKVVGSAETGEEGLRVLSEQSPELAICCAAPGEREAFERRMSDAHPFVVTLWADAKEYSDDPERYIGKLINRVKGAVSDIEEVRHGGLRDAGYVSKQTETAAQSLSELAEAGDYDGLRSLVFSYIDRITAWSGGDRLYIYMKIMELIMLADYRPGKNGSSFERLLRSDFSRKLQQMLLQDSAGGIDRFLYRSICDSIPMSARRREEELNFSLFEKAIAYIAEHYRRKLTLDEVARQVFISPSYFSNCFHQRMGVTFSEYLSQIRIDKAKELLNDTNLKIYEVAEKSGYEDFRHFGKMFKKYVGTTPAQYRRAHGDNQG